MEGNKTVSITQGKSGPTINRLLDLTGSLNKPSHHQLKKAISQVWFRVGQYSTSQEIRYVEAIHQ